MRTVDLAGKRFGQLSVLSRDEARRGGNAFWICKCDCGKYSSVSGSKLLSSMTVSCGCLHGRFRLKDISGTKSGKLTVIGFDRMDGSQSRWRCICECGNECSVRLNAIKRGQKSCGCSSRGSNHYRYRHDIDASYRTQDRRYNKDVKAWRELIYEKDGYSCQKCGDRTGGNLNAHHINSWNKFESMRFDLDNGITLCDICHKSFHSKYGYGDNNESQIKEFLQTKDKHE